jgi:hypothetical protein
MITLITSCDRHDLLITTLESLVKNQKHRLAIAINEDSSRVLVVPAIRDTMINTYRLDGKGQNHSIETFLRAAIKMKGRFYLHCEDDWEFDNNYDWITESLKIMQSDPKIIKVLCRSDSVHPCEFKNGYGILEPWTDPWKGHVWHGFGWNPGITRIDLLAKFLPLKCDEQTLSKKIYDAGYKTALLEKGVCKHIGEGRSTHEQ